jgi:hypothetical protein
MFHRLTDELSRFYFSAATLREKCGVAEHARPGARNSAVEPIHAAGIGSGEGINPAVREAPSPGCGAVMSPSPIPQGLAGGCRAAGRCA